MLMALRILQLLTRRSIAKALTKRKIKAGNEWVEQDLKLEAANDGRDALSKAIYSRLFDYLIATINTALRAGGDTLSDKDAQVRSFAVRAGRVCSLEARPAPSLPSLYLPKRFLHARSPTHRPCRHASTLHQIIGIVDIFGFEVFVENSLEQLCIKCVTHSQRPYLSGFCTLF